MIQEVAHQGLDSHLCSKDSGEVATNTTVA